MRSASVEIIEFNPFDFLFSKFLTAALIVLAFALLFKAFFIVHQQHPKVVERFGRFLKIAHPGLNFKIPFIDRVVATISLLTYNVTIPVVTQTKDNVFVTIKIAIQYRIKAGKEREAFYTLQDAVTSIKQYVVGVVLQCVRDIELDLVFSNKEKIAQQVRTELENSMAAFGYEIVETLVNEVEPDQKVVESMNAINAAQRLQQAAKAEGEAAKIKQVALAQAEKESKKLQGEGIAEQRKAIAKGLQESLSMFQDVHGLDNRVVMETLMLTQYFDTMKSIAGTSKSNVIFVPHQPGSVADLSQQIRDGVMMANAYKEEV